VAPAGTVEQRDGFQRGASTLERLGFRVRFDERIFQTSRYLAGDDSARAEELMRALKTTRSRLSWLFAADMDAPD